jgi:hypothetical protein
VSPFADEAAPRQPVADHLTAMLEHGVQAGPNVLRAQFAGVGAWPHSPRPSAGSRQSRPASAILIRDIRASSPATRTVLGTMKGFGKIAILFGLLGGAPPTAMSPIATAALMRQRRLTSASKK